MNKRKLAAAIAVPVLGAAAYLGVALSASAPSSTVSLPYTDSNGVAITSVCSGTNPQYLVHSGGADITVKPGSTQFTVTNGGNGLLYADPYEAAGYNNSTNSNACNNAKVGDSPVVPVKLGSQGNPVASIHTITGTAPSDYFYGNTGYDLWFTPSPADNTYAEMSGGGSVSYPVATEIMVWTSNTDLVTSSTNVKDYPVVIDGLHWLVQVGLAADGHGKSTSTPRGWNVVNLIAPNNHLGNVVMSNLALDPIVTYAIDHGYLASSDYWEGINAGMEITEGNAELAGFTLVGMK